MLFEEIQKWVNYTTTYLSRSYPLVDPDDLSQELWVWVARHVHTLKEWQEDELGKEKLKKSLRNAGIDFAKKEQEARSHVTGTDGEGYGIPLWVEILDGVEDASDEL